LGKTPVKFKKPFGNTKIGGFKFPQRCEGNPKKEGILIKERKCPKKLFKLVQRAKEPVEISRAFKQKRGLPNTPGIVKIPRQMFTKTNS